MPPFGQDQSEALGEDTKVRLGPITRVYVFIGLAVLGGAGSMWAERGERREGDLALRTELDEKLARQERAILDLVSATYVKEESSNYRAKQLSGELEKAIDRLNTELAYLRRDVAGISETVREIPTISAQLKVLQERKQ